jgi:hypothetical protein
MPPDCFSAAELAPKIALLRRVAADWVEFYHYGFMRLLHLDWIAGALASQAAAQ